MDQGHDNFDRRYNTLNLKNQIIFKILYLQKSIVFTYLQIFFITEDLCNKH